MPDDDGDDGLGATDVQPAGDLEDRKDFTLGRSLNRQVGSGSGSITHGVPLQRDISGPTVSPTQQNKLRMRRR